MHQFVGRRNVRRAYQGMPTSAIPCQGVPTGVSGRSRRPVEHKWSTRDRADGGGANQCQALPTADNHCQPLTEHFPSTAKITSVASAQGAAVRPVGPAPMGRAVAPPAQNA
jgi:hypothetical protein